MLKYKNFKLIRPDKIQKLGIEKIVLLKNGSIFHEIKFNEIVEKHFESKLMYLVDDTKNITTFSPIHIEEPKKGLSKYYFQPNIDIPYAGFVGSKEICIKDISVNFFESFEYHGFPYVDKTPSNDLELNVGETTMVDLNLAENDIFEKIIHSKRRNMVRKAIKSDISIRTFNDEQGLKQFWPFLQKLHEKLGLGFLSYEYYNDVLKYYGAKNKAFVLIAYKSEKPISGIFLIGNENYMHYYKGASSYEVKNEGQGELLQWEAIKLSKTLGIKYYDLCNLEKDRLPSIYRFKTGIVNNIFKYPKYKINSLGYKVIRKIQNSL